MFGKKQFTFGCDNAPHFISKEILYAVTIGFEKRFKNVVCIQSPFAKQHGKTDLDRSFQKDGFALDEFAKKRWLGNIKQAMGAIRRYQTEANFTRQRRGLRPIMISVVFIFTKKIHFNTNLFLSVQVHSVTIKKPTAFYGKVELKGIQSTQSVVWDPATQTLYNTVFPDISRSTSGKDTHSSVCLIFYLLVGTFKTFVNPLTMKISVEGLSLPTFGLWVRNF